MRTIGWNSQEAFLLKKKYLPKNGTVITTGLLPELGSASLSEVYAVEPRDFQSLFQVRLGCGRVRVPLGSTKLF